MTCLILLRHAKAVPAAADDHARGLSPRGVADAAWAGGAIAAGGWRPDAALVSDARRTRDTFAAAAPRLGAAPPALLAPALYEATVEQVLEQIAATPPDIGCLLVVGHNPGIAAAAVRLARHGASEPRARLADGFPTAALAVFTFPGSKWDAVADGGTLDAFLSPP